ncbi:MAG: hypothetical protein JNK85_06930 [Verrucomicrobiales bacterium]|nr:hypothetical protein [Verrucomicrobiales bacterium]
MPNPAQPTPGASTPRSTASLGRKARVVASFVLGSLGLLTIAGQVFLPGRSVPDKEGVVDPALASDNEPKKVHEIRIRKRVAVLSVDTGARHANGDPIRILCSSCHATTRPRIETRGAAELDEFHQGLTYRHGDLTCLSCHDATNYDRLRRADGGGISFADVMELCGQCHGPQSRDYRNGSHGGMTGHWDLTRGPRERNNCVDCHDPHAPQYPLVMPVFAPRHDRGRHPASTTATDNLRPVSHE